MIPKIRTVDITISTARTEALLRCICPSFTLQTPGDISVSRAVACEHREPSKRPLRVSLRSSHTLRTT